VGLRDANIEELYGGPGEGGGSDAAPPTPTVDALNDMLRWATAAAAVAR
jgi:hypothetical protein